LLLVQSNQAEITVVSCFFAFLPLSLLLVQSHQAEIIVVKRFIQGRNNVCDMGVGVEPGSSDRDHTVAIKTAL